MHAINGHKKRNKTGTSEKWKDQDNPIPAYKEVKRCVRKLLKFPSTATFPNLDDCHINHVACLANQNYRVKSYVDSENMQETIIRAHFTAELQQIASGKWSLFFLEME